LMKDELCIEIRNEETYHTGIRCCKSRMRDAIVYSLRRLEFDETIDPRLCPAADSNAHVAMASAEDWRVSSNRVSNFCNCAIFFYCNQFVQRRPK
jgi:hypothetical protein